jgi:hypothetical protein
MAESRRPYRLKFRQDLIPQDEASTRRRSPQEVDVGGKEIVGPELLGELALEEPMMEGVRLASTSRAPRINVVADVVEAVLRPYALGGERSKDGGVPCVGPGLQDAVELGGVQLGVDLERGGRGTATKTSPGYLKVVSHHRRRSRRKWELEAGVGPKDEGGHELPADARERARRGAERSSDRSPARG